MKLYLKDGNVFEIKEGVSLEFLNLNEFVSDIKEHSKNVPVGHFIETLKYKLTDGDKTYLGETKCDSYNGFTNQIDENSAYSVEIVNFGHLSEEDAFIEVNITEK